VRSTAIAAVGAAALLVLSGAAALAATPSPIPDTIGLRLTPAPILLDEGDRRIRAVNISGGLPVRVVLEASPGYVVEPAVFTLEPDGVQVVEVVQIDEEADGTLTATATAAGAADGMVRSVAVLGTRFVHRTWLEEHGSTLVLLLAAAAALVLLVARRRRRQKGATA
jgi:MYXO-CTERM domain-containing protein